MNIGKLRIIFSVQLYMQGRTSFPRPNLIHMIREPRIVCPKMKRKSAKNKKVINQAGTETYKASRTIPQSL